MTISLEGPEYYVAAQTVQRHSMVDPYDEPHTTIALNVLVSRDHLAAAVGAGGVNYYGGEREPDEWTVAEVRYFAESNLLTMNALELQQDSEMMARMATPAHRDPDERAFAFAVYRAVDRAFPKTC